MIAVAVSRVFIQLSRRWRVQVVAHALLCLFLSAECTNSSPPCSMRCGQLDNDAGQGSFSAWGILDSPRIML